MRRLLRTHKPSECKGITKRNTRKDKPQRDDTTQKKVMIKEAANVILGG
jgi:hypothetical protein